MATSSPDNNVINPLMESPNSQDDSLQFPSLVRSPPFPRPPGVRGPPLLHPLPPGASPLMPLHPPPGLPPPGLMGPPPHHHMDGPPPLGMAPPIMMPGFPVPSNSQAGGAPILLTTPPGSSPQPSGPLLLTPPTNNPPMHSGHVDNSPPTNMERQQSLGNNEQRVESKEVWLEHISADGSIYYSDPVTRKTTWEKPTDANIIPFAPPNPNPVPSIRNEPPVIHGGPPVPSNNIPGLPPGIPLVPQRVWSEHDNPEGRTYYYNKVTRQSVWEKPKDLELVMPLPLDLTGPPDAMPTSMDNQTNQLDGVNQSIPSTNPPLIPHIPPSLLSEPPPANNDRQPEEEPEMDPKELLALVASKLGTGPPNFPATAKLVTQSSKPNIEPNKGPRPTTSVPVPGTPWSVVYTTDEKLFFFDATNRKSFWDLPPELEENLMVFKILDNPPWRKKRVGAVDEPASKRIKFDDDEGENVDEPMEVVGVVSGGLPSPVIEGNKGEGGESDPSSLITRETKMAEMRASLPLEERQRDFKEMLLERQVSAFSTWEKELPKFVFDDRFHLLVLKERKVAFEEFITTRAEEEMREKKQKMKERKELFMRLLQEPKITKKTSFSEFSRMFSKDERFKCIDKMRERETLFQERVSELKKVNRQREEDQRQAARSRGEKIKSDFFSMLSEASKLTPHSQWRKVKGIFQRDSRYQAVDSSSQREDYFEEYIKQLGKDDKHDLVQASLREREREVELSRTAQREQWEKERDQLRRTDAERTFGNMLVDLVKDPLSSWSNTRKTLRKDHRWDVCEMIEGEEKERLFKEHVVGLQEKRRGQFRRLLEETSKISLKMPWRKARKLIKEDPRYKKYSDSDEQRKAEYERYLRDKMVQSKNDFKSLLKETRVISHKTKDAIRESNKNLKDIINTLEKDQRYLVLECISEEREDILMEYIDDLYRRGPPPPPTATHPSERLRK